MNIYLEDAVRVLEELRYRGKELSSDRHLRWKDVNHWAWFTFIGLEPMPGYQKTFERRCLNSRHHFEERLFAGIATVESALKKLEENGECDLEDPSLEYCRLVADLPD